MDPMPPHIEIPYKFANDLKAESAGAELSIDWRPLSWWRIAPSYSYLHLNFTQPSSTDIIITGAGQAPRNQIFVRSQMDFPHEVELDAALRYVDSMPTEAVTSYWNLDLRLGWKPYRNCEFALVGRNLLQAHKKEFESNIIQTANTEIDRAVFGKVTFSF